VLLNPGVYHGALLLNVGLHLLELLVTLLVILFSCFVSGFVLGVLVRSLLVL
jgi:hypothetical protein